MGILTLSRKRLAHLALLGVLAASTASGCASTDKEREVQRLHAQAAYEQGVKHLQDKRISLGLVSLQQAISLAPENAIYRNALGVVYLDMRRPLEAEKEFQKAVELDPAYAEAHHNLGLALAEQGQFERAIAGYRKALAVPTYTTPEVAYNNLANVLFAQGKFRDAEDAYRAAIQLNGRLPSALYGLGMALSRQGRQEDAKAALRSARDMDTSSPFAQAAVEALKALGEPPQAPGSTR
jgi:Tfp pilus assembly protein PilF